ncbi:unnamed protein product [Thelazia callipaeda]|uniref:L-ornithine N(5)-monooxygenase (NAD(P)H) n=1 Tax=Thelazia callipaeda TaxID=103827 RepID=A0A0N5D2B2_THECL|nr:unnamed protein product [Thelazia callipaeda]
MRQEYFLCRCKTGSKICSTLLSTSPVPKLDAEVIIIGNGPAGLSLSAFLSGWLPFYSPDDSPHPNEFIHDKLSEHNENSLFDQDFSWLDNSINIMNSGARPFSLLFDNLMRPSVDNINFRSSVLTWIYNPSRAISHLVIAETPLGGSWNHYDDNMISVSVDNLLDLPAFRIADWRDGSDLNRRLPASVYRKYLSDYAEVMLINKQFTVGFRVEQIKVKCCTSNCKEQYWEVLGTKNNKLVLLKCKKVVLACGKNRDRLLGVKGELEGNRIVYNLRDLKQMLASSATFFPLKRKVIVVGDGISAADSVLHCLNSNISVLHVIRRVDEQLQFTKLSRLNVSIYPEYARVFNLMTGRCRDSLYTKITCATVESVNEGSVLIKTAQGTSTEHFEILCICIGKESDLSMLADKYTFQDYYCNEDSSLFCIGSLAEDHFVRYLIGGAMEVARSLMYSC